MANHRDRNGRGPARPDVQLVPLSENRLKRETPYVCNVRFHADLPEVPCDPKMLIAPLQPEKLAQFSLTTLERNPRRDLVLEADLGIHISLLDIKRYSVPDNPQPLAPEDAALLADDAEAAAPPTVAATAVANTKARERARGARAEVSWLMRTTYISSETLERRAQGAPDKRARAEHNGVNQAELDERAAHLAQVEESFEAMQRTPVHGRNPELTPVAILPVLPDEERGVYNYVQATFDSDPTADIDRLARLSDSQRQQLAERAAVKSYSLRKQDGGQDQFVAYLLPLDEPRGADEAGPSREGAEARYEWIREYSYKVQNADEHTTFWFLFGDDCVTYINLSTRLDLKKRAKARKEGESDFQRPAKIILTQMPPEPLEDRPAKRARPEEAEVQEARSPDTDAEHALQVEADAPTWLPEAARSD